MSEQTVQVFCMPTDWSKPFEPVEMGQCPDCGTDVWISSSTKVQVAEAHPQSPVVYLCIPCGYQRILVDGGKPEFQMPMSQYLHLQTRVGKDAIDKVIAALGIEVQP